MELLQRVAQERVILATHGVDAGKDQALGLLITGEGCVGRASDCRDGVADLCIAHALEPGRDVADFARHQLSDRHQLRPEDAELKRVGDGATGHQPDLVAVADGALGQPDVDDHALVGVVMAVEDEALERFRGIALGRRDARDDRLEDLVHPGPVLGRGEDHLLARDGQDVLQLIHYRVGICRGQVDLVEDRDEGQVLLHRQVDVGQRLGLDALGGIDHEDRALAGLQAVADLVREVDVAGRIDEIEAIRLAVARLVLEADGPGLDGDPLLALEVHRIEDLTHHLAPLDRVGQLEQPVGERRLAVIDVGDDREVAQAVLGDGHEAAV